jgi:hypothetical protein
MRKVWLVSISHLVAAAIVHRRRCCCV